MTDGFNGTSIAYGQTTTGKTHTVQGGSGQERGVIPRAFEQLFDNAKAFESGTRYLFQVSLIEIYNDDIRDLLDVKGKLAMKERLDGAVFIKGVSTYLVNGVDDCLLLMERGRKRRSTGSTPMNPVSSQSHSVFTVHVGRRDQSAYDDNSSGDRRRRASKLNLVDLTVSERQSKTIAIDMRLREAAKINSLLSALDTLYRHWSTAGTCRTATPS